MGASDVLFDRDDMAGWEARSMVTGASVAWAEQSGVGVVCFLWSSQLTAGPLYKKMYISSSAGLSLGMSVRLAAK